MKLILLEIFFVGLIALLEFLIFWFVLKKDISNLHWSVKIVIGGLTLFAAKILAGYFY